MADEPRSWMADLPDYATVVPLTRLAIPGSHDSGTAHLERSLGIANDEVELLKVLKYVPCCECIATGVAYRWSKTQNLTLKEQLQAGIRYLDLRVSLRDGTAELRFLHGLYAIEVAEGLNAIYEFMEENSSEVVILHFQHLYNMSSAVHTTLLTMIANIFGDKLVPQADPVQSLDQLWKTTGRVIVIYNNAAGQSLPNIWPGSAINSPWANADSAKELTSFLQNSYTKWNKSTNKTFFGSQGVLTPTKSDILTRFYSNLQTCYSDQATEAFIDWLTRTVIQPESINICLADFVDKYDFIQTVIGLNIRNS